MKITSLEIKQHEFEKAFRGYNIEEVDIFLNNIANEWERTSNEAKMLRMQLEIAEKEAAKLREVEMSLIKTLQTAENTSHKIAEHAKNEAENEIQKARIEAERIVEEAEITANKKLTQVENQVSESQKALIEREKTIRHDIIELETYKTELVQQLKQMGMRTFEHIQFFEKNAVATPEMPVAQAKPIVKQEVEEVKAIASSANRMVLEAEAPPINMPYRGTQQDDLTMIEGIGPKIAELLRNQNIESFRDIITTPSYKIKEILQAAGGNFGLHDPATWAQQARLAEAQNWQELDSLKATLRGGRSSNYEVSQVELADTRPTNAEQVTEEMLDRVNKVKAALKKAMITKEQDDSLHGNPDRGISGGSFFDNL